MEINWVEVPDLWEEQIRKLAVRPASYTYFAPDHRPRRLQTRNCLLSSMGGPYRISIRL